MDRPNKCKNCQWYGKPYWSIINPCDNCPMEYVETFTHWVDPNIKELKEENEKLKEENEKLKLTLEALDVPENMSYYFRERYKIISARMYKAIKLFQDCGEDWSTLPLDMYEALTGEDLKPKGSEVNENNENN